MFIGSRRRFDLIDKNSIENKEPSHLNPVNTNRIIFTVKTSMIMGFSIGFTLKIGQCLRFDMSILYYKSTIYKP